MKITSKRRIALFQSGSGIKNIISPNGSKSSKKYLPKYIICRIVCSIKKHTLAGVVELVDAPDSKSGILWMWGFESPPRHHFKAHLKRCFFVYYFISFILKLEVKINKAILLLINCLIQKGVEYDKCSQKGRYNFTFS